MSLPSPAVKSSEIIDDGKRPFTVHLGTFAQATERNRRDGFVAPCDLTVIGAFFGALASSPAGATLKLKIGTATSATQYVTGRKFGGTNGPAKTTFWDLFTTANGAAAWLATKRAVSKGAQIIALVTKVAAATASQAATVTLVCVPR